MASKPKKAKYSYKTTGGERVTKFNDGTEKRTGGGSSDNAITNAKVDAGNLPESQRENMPQDADALLARGNAMIEQTKAEGNKQFKGSSYDTGFEPTTISDTNVREKYIPEIDSKINKYAETGQYYDANGNLHNADGTISESKDTTQDSAYSTGSSEADGLMTSANSDSKLIFDTLDTLMKQTDKDTASQIQSIKAQYDIREKQLEEINRREQLGEATSLLLGGSSRYTGSASGIMAGYQRADIMELAELDAKEMSAISEAKAAQSEKNYNLASKKLDYVETLRKEKVAKATEIAKAIADENKKTREAQIKMTREAAIADMFQQGITDPAEMLGLIAEQGGDITLKEIDDTLKIINPDANLAGASSDYKTYKMMQKAGEIPEGWNFFDYKTAVTNAGKSGSGASDNFTKQEENKLEQKFGADWKNTTSRQEQLDYVYGEDATDTIFTDTQLAQGATSAGVSIENFMRIDDEQKNEYINGRLKDLAPDIDGLLQSIEPDNEDDKKEVYEAIRNIIESAGFDVEDYRGGMFAEGNENMGSLDSLYMAFQASR